jgi:alkanesulfonate monooxygenase SsuD/methylene tetrahydromethanopterin reductase-like flavin-dependent oxidoreductase (luciferase family)
MMFDRAIPEESIKTMAKDLKNIKFGVNIHTSIQPGVPPVTEARHAEQLGFDIVTLHHDALHSSNPSFELWTLLTWMAAHTTSIRVAPVVLALPHRHPAVLAKMAETLDRLSDGRLILVLGGGGPMNEPAYRAFGLTQRSPREKVEALEEAIDILRGLWSTSDFSHTGPHFKTEGATIEPKPGHHIPLWLGVFGDRMIDLVGRKADGWLPTYQFLAPEQAYQKLERIRTVAENAGRNPDEITYGYNIPILIEDGAVTNRWRIAGTAQKVAAQLAAIARHGFTFLNIWPSGDAAIQRERLARDVLPAVRDLIG